MNPVRGKEGGVRGNAFTHFSAISAEFVVKIFLTSHPSLLTD
jgi:hypothetical protein